MAVKNFAAVLLVLLCFANYFFPLAECDNAQANNSFLNPRQLSTSPDHSDCSIRGPCQGYLYGVRTRYKTRGLNVLEAEKIANNMGQNARVAVGELGIFNHIGLPKPQWTYGEGEKFGHAIRVAGVILGQYHMGQGVRGMASKAAASSFIATKFWDIVDEFWTWNDRFKRGDVIVSAIAKIRKPGDCERPYFDSFGMRDITAWLTMEKG